jgi:hypothetical protein
MKFKKKIEGVVEWRQLGIDVHLIMKGVVERCRKKAISQRETTCLN